MKLVIKQKILSWFDTFHIYDEYDNVVYTIKGEFALCKTLRIYDKDNREIGYIKRKILTLMSQYDMFDNSGNIGVIKRKFSLKPNYEIEPFNFRIMGDFIGWNFSIVNSADNILATIKKRLNLRDTYEIDVFDESNILIIIMIVLAIDADKQNAAVSAANSN